MTLADSFFPTYSSPSQSGSSSSYDGSGTPSRCLHDGVVLSYPPPYPCVVVSVVHLVVGVVVASVVHVVIGSSVVHVVIGSSVVVVGSSVVVVGSSVVVVGSSVVVVGSSVVVVLRVVHVVVVVVHVVVVVVVHPYPPHPYDPGLYCLFRISGDSSLSLLARSAR